MWELLLRGGVQGRKWDGLKRERGRAGRGCQARAPAAGAVREVVDGRETSHVFVVRGVRVVVGVVRRQRVREIHKRDVDRPRRRVLPEEVMARFSALTARHESRMVQTRIVAVCKELCGLGRVTESETHTLRLNE